MSSSTLVLALAVSSILSAAATAAQPRETHPCAKLSDTDARVACYDEAFGAPAEPGAARTAPEDARPEKDAAPPANGAAPPARPSPENAESAASVEAVAPASPAAASPAVAVHDDFGLSEAQKEARGKKKDTAPESMEAVVSKIRRTATGAVVLTLDSGQVWVQSEPETNARVSVGDHVTIRRGALTSYQLITPSRIAMRVRRVK